MRTCFLLLIAVLCSPIRAADHFNLVFILADDLGWSDTSLNGTSKYYDTPNIDRLGKRGMVFSNAYSANPLCSPTRASILTGLYPGRLGITAPACHLPEERKEASLVARASPQHKALQQISATRLATTHPTLAKSLKQAGYATGHFGKWHLGPDPYSPLQQGFDVDVPHWHGPGPAGTYIAPWRFPQSLSFTGPKDQHLEDRMASEAAKFIRQNRDKPFFLNYWAFSVHSPWDAKKSLIDDYAKKANPASPQRNPVYAAMVRSLDDAVGTLLDTLDELKLADRTIVVFFSDNGGFIWKGNQLAAEYDCPVTSNAPLRGGKATLYEGGTRVPCAVIWPGKVAAGSRSAALLSSVDWYPTLLEILGITPPEARLDGVSQVPALLGKGAAPRNEVYVFFPHYTPLTGAIPGTWVRQGDWKLIRFHHDGDKQADRFELYNLKDDLGETRDLSAEHPDRVRQLDALIAEHLKSTGALVPTKNPDFAREPAWAAGKDAKAQFREGTAVVESQAGRPIFHLLQISAPKGNLMVKFRMRGSEGKGGFLLWGTQKANGFAPARRATFEAVFDGQWHEYEVKFTPDDTLTSLRIDGSLQPAKVEFDWIRLCDDGGKVIKAWEF